MEYWTDGNLVINNKGGLNTNEKDKSKSWKVYRSLNKLVLNKNGNELLRLSMTEKSITELMQFFNKYSIPFKVV